MAARPVFRLKFSGPAGLRGPPGPCRAQMTMLNGYLCTWLQLSKFRLRKRKRPQERANVKDQRISKTVSLFIRVLRVV